MALGHDAYPFVVIDIKAHRLLSAKVRRSLAGDGMRRNMIADLITLDLQDCISQGEMMLIHC